MTDNEITKTSGEISNNKIKAIYPHIVVSGNVNKPYYSIQWYDIEKKTMFDGYASYELKFVREWLQENFEVVETDIDNLINRQQAEIERLNRLTDDLVKIADTRKKANFSLLKEKILLTRELKSAKSEATEQLSKKIEIRLANNTNISNAQYQSIIFDISEACKEMVGDAE